ncbi:MoxR family ATPase [Micrococcales bacterium 31B]|nr:MoxR family ATPase [Micrococcales bacterium 31B]
MSLTPEQATRFAQIFDRLVSTVGASLLGKTHVVRLSLTVMFAEGHLLLEDLPGTGKTSLARSIAAAVQGENSRIQFTPDLLPSDVTGVSMYDQDTKQFEFHKGPVFATVLLADEINRASPKTQSALLEVMEESTVTVDGVTHPVGRPFLVIATQNPIEQAGTYRLPEAQLDRFMVKTSIGHPDFDTTVQVLSESAVRDRSAQITHVVTPKMVAEMAEAAQTVHVDPAISRYVARLMEETRNAPEVRAGVSMRGGIALLRAAKVWAAANGRHFVLPDDIKALAGPVWTHRLVLDAEAEFAGATDAGIMQRVLAEVAPPQARDLTQS